MHYFVKEIQTSEGAQKTAGVKAREDADVIFEENKLVELPITNDIKNRRRGGVVRKLFFHAKLNSDWKKATLELKKGDSLFIQFPCIEHTVFLGQTIRKLKKRGVSIVLLIHDLEILRVSRRKDVSLKKRIRLKIEEKDILFIADKIIAHNTQMKEYLINIGISEEKIISLDIFDYLIEDFDQQALANVEAGKNDPIIIAGNLRQHKAGYVYDLPTNMRFNLYGVGYNGKSDDAVSYKGAFDPDQLIYCMQGSFGLVWDGEISSTCAGVYGDYLKINNPHKTSLYLAAQIPVIIWKEAALAPFIKNNKCGILVESIQDAKTKIEGMSDTEYSILKQNAKAVGAMLRCGNFLNKAVKQCLM